MNKYINYFLLETVDRIFYVTFRYKESVKIQALEADYNMVKAGIILRARWDLQRLPRSHHEFLLPKIRECYFLTTIIATGRARGGKYISTRFHQQGNLYGPHHPSQRSARLTIFLPLALART